MQISDILLRVRTRLRDIKFDSLRFSDNELLDYATSAQNDLIFEFNANLQEIVRTLNNENTFILPHNVLSIIAIFLNNTQIPLKAYPLILNNDSSIAIFQKSSNSYRNFPKNQGNIRFRLIFNNKGYIINLKKFFTVYYTGILGGKDEK